MRNDPTNARRLRRAMILPEVLLWRVLRARPEGLKFRRQHPIAGYVIDFFCRDAALAIEIDGEAHDRGDRPARDAERNAVLRSFGIETLRIPARDVIPDLDDVIRHIITRAGERIPLHHPSGGPPPRGNLGED